MQDGHVFNKCRTHIGELHSEHMISNKHHDHFLHPLWVHPIILTHGGLGGGGYDEQWQPSKAVK